MKIIVWVLIGVSFLGILYSGFYFGGWIYEFQSAEANVSNSFQMATALGSFDSKVYEKISERKELDLIFAGDIMFDRGVKTQILKVKDFNYPFLATVDFLNSADITFANLEGPISERGKNQGSIYSFRFDPQVVDALQFAGFDILSVANNHIFDYGEEGLVDTVQILRNKGIYSIGAGENYEIANGATIFERENIKIAYLAYTDLYPRGLMAQDNRPGVSDSDLEKIKQRIKELKSQVDLVMVSWHWGVEYQLKSNENQKKVAHELIEAGADLIIGHHPHVAQEIEKYKQGWIIYSLGNFVFDQNFSKETMEGLLVKIKIKGGKIQDPESFKVKIDSTFQPSILKTEAF